MSLLMVARNAERFIDAALRSARRQTFQQIEIVVVDDGSTDSTRSIVQSHMAADSRVKLFKGPEKGLAAVRNFSLAQASARYAAILDSDDLLHPRHVEELYNTAIGRGAQIVATNMLTFQDGQKMNARFFGNGAQWREVQEISREEFIQAGCLDSDAPSLGYLKPLFDLEFLEEHQLEYDPTLRIGEDYDLVDRALRKDGVFVVSPAVTYFYRRHDQSTSHRLTRQDLRSLYEADERKSHEEDPVAVRSATASRKRSLQNAILHLDVVNALKKRAFGKAIAILTAHPSVIPLLWHSVREGLLARVRRIFGSVPARDDGAKRVLVLGAARRGSPIGEAIRELRMTGYDVHRIDLETGAARLEQISRRAPFAAIILADDDAVDLAPYGLSPDAPWVADGSIDTALIDVHLTSDSSVRHRSRATEVATDSLPEFIADLAMQDRGISTL